MGWDGKDCLSSHDTAMMFSTLIVQHSELTILRTGRSRGYPHCRLHEEDQLQRKNDHDQGTPNIGHMMQYPLNGLQGG